MLHNEYMLLNIGAKIRLEGLERDVIRAVWTDVPLVSFGRRVYKWRGMPLVLRRLADKPQHANGQPALLAFLLWEPGTPGGNRGIYRAGLMQNIRPH